MNLAAAVPTQDTYLSYGLAGLIVVTIVLPMALYIKRMWQERIAESRADLLRAQAENIEYRKALEQFPPVLAEMTRTMKTTLAIVERSRQ